MTCRWQKLELVYPPEVSDRHPKLMSHAANPLPLQIEGDLYRFLYSARDDANRFPFGAVDIDIVRRRVVEEHRQPFFEHGPEGSLYEAGVGIGCCYEVDRLRYLLLTFLGLTPKLTMTLLYFIVAFAGLWRNRNLIFRHQGSVLGSGVRYLVAHGLGYLINLLILVVFVNQLGFTHQCVQAIAILVVAGYLFVAFKFFVLARLESLAGGGP